MNNTLYVLCMVQNALGYKSRIRNYEIFKQQMRRPGIALYTAEIAFGDAPHVIRPETYGDMASHYLQLRTDCELWNKDGALNLLAQRLPEDAEYIVWADADVVWTRPDWVQETIRLLQQYDVIQMFSHTQDLGASCQPVGKILLSYYYRYVVCGRDFNTLRRNKEMITGLAWASKKSILSRVGMFPDWCVLSSGDRHMAAGFLGEMGSSFKGNLTEEYKLKCIRWGERARDVVQGNISYLPGLLLHYWHGERNNRGYLKRWDVMSTFNPETDIVKDWQGLYRWTDRNPKLRDKFRMLMRERNEDEQGEVLIP